MPTTEYALKLLRLLQAQPALSQRELASALGLSLGKTHYCVRALLDQGFITMQDAKDYDHPRGYAYLVTSEGLHAKTRLARRFLTQKQKEYEILKQEIEQLRREVGVHG